MRFEVFTVVKSQVDVFLVATPYSVLVGYQHLRGEVTSPRRWMQHGHPKHWYSTMRVHGITTQETSTWRQHYCIFPFIFKVLNVTEWSINLMVDSNSPTISSLCVALRNTHVQGYQVVWIIFLPDGMPASLWCYKTNSLFSKCVVFCTVSYQRTVLFWKECLV